MEGLSPDLRNRLAAAIKAARRVGESGARRALGVLAVGAARAHASMSPAEQELRRRLRAHGRQLGDGRDSETGEQKTDRLAHEVAYEHWHRMLFARFLAENELLIEPESGVAVSLPDCEELAREQGQDRWTLAGRFAELLLPRIFRSDDPALAVRLAPETRQELERLIEALPADIFAASDALGWTYQFWQAERKDAVIRRLPDLTLACSGLAPNAPRDEWTRLSDDAAVVDAGGLPPKRDLLGVEDTLMSAPLRNSLGALHDLFAQAPVLGSLIDPRAVEADLFQHDYESVRVLLGALLEQERSSDEQTERAVAAQGMARAAELLAGRYHLVITNVPYLARGKQSDELKQFAQDRHPAAKGDLATLFVSRIFGWLDKHGVEAVVTPQNWLFLTSYKKLREKLLKQRTWNLVARLGPGAFETIGGHVVNVALNVLSADTPTRDWRMAGIDVSGTRGRKSIRADEKAALLRGGSDDADAVGHVLNGAVHAAGQRAQLGNPDSMLAFRSGASREHLSRVALAYQGTSTGDNFASVLAHWEFPCVGEDWTRLQAAPDEAVPFSGRAHLLRRDVLDSEHTTSTVRGHKAWQHDGVAVSQTGRLVPTRYTGEHFSNVIPVVVPHDTAHLNAVWCFCESGELENALRTFNSKLSVDNGYFGKIPFDLSHWQEVAAEKYPNGLPEPYSNDPRQWVFHGHPCGGVAWDENTKRIVHGPQRIDATVLQVAVARLVGYRWPAEQDLELRVAPEAREWIERCRDLADADADADGIVCLPSVGGEFAAADRLRQLLVAAYGADWSAETERRLLVAAAGRSEPVDSIEAWLRDRFFEEHCQHFLQRPFVWHIWDGRRDGFHALLNYHRLAGSDGVCRRTLEALTYSRLGTWIARQGAHRDQGIDGADGRLAAAQDLQNQLVKVLAGEPPCDIFVRWKPLDQQPLGWEPDINDGVRVNIRPFMSVELAKGGRAGAGILRAKPKIAWGKDRGMEALKPRKRWKPPWLDDDHEADVDEERELRPRDDYPWFWGCRGGGTLTERTNFRGGPDFDGNRWNDLHYTNACKRAARSRKRIEDNA